MTTSTSRSSDIIDVSALIVCPVCHGDLSSGTEPERGCACSACGRRYQFENLVYDLTPVPPPDELLRSRWETWQKLQENGSVSYTTAPEFNLSVGVREDAMAFGSFCEADGLILDVGCGPQPRPSYLPKAARVVGIDPLLGEQPREFAFVRGLGEYLPFRDETFDHILYATSLDHIIDPRRSLSEAGRCLKPGGCVSLWLDAQAPNYSTGEAAPLQRYRLLLKKGLASLSRHNWISNLGLGRTLSYIGAVARMKVPAGAIDYFHFEHLTQDEVTRWLRDLGLAITRREEYPAGDSLFMQARK